MITMHIALAYRHFVSIQVFTGGAVPFSGLPSATAIVSLAQGTRPPRPTHRTFTEDLWTLMQRCWDHDFSLRPEVSGVFQGLTLSRLTSSTLSAYERTRLITTIFSDQDQVKMIRQVSGDDAQTFVDVADGVRVPISHSDDSFGSNHTFLIRFWIASHQRPAEGVCAFYTRFVAAKPWFHDYWRFRFVTI